ncbi:hypothetical protein FACS1894201_04470 [Bacteroidia bacterium]|nr:hypothetical protein FACS1894201_04470 [Bacteroidia bacterium]
MKKTYTEAYSELQDIVQSLENEDTDIDSLSTSIQRAIALINICNEKLALTEQEVQALVKQIEEQN